MIEGAAHPVKQAHELDSYAQLKADHFLSRREIGIVSIAGNGTIAVDREKYKLEKESAYSLCFTF